MCVCVCVCVCVRVLLGGACYSIHPYTVMVVSLVATHTCHTHTLQHTPVSSQVNLFLTLSLIPPHPSAISNPPSPFFVTL